MSLARLTLAVAALALALSGCHVPGHVDDLGAPPAEQQQQPKKACAPQVAWVHPGAGTVTDVKVCPGLFGTEIRYILVDSGPRQVWLTDPGRSCKVGKKWGPTTC